MAKGKFKSKDIKHKPVIFKINLEKEHFNCLALTDFCFFSWKLRFFFFSDDMFWGKTLHL